MVAWFQPYFDPEQKMIEQELRTSHRQASRFRADLSYLPGR
jgi:hypothetical protein